MGSISKERRDINKKPGFITSIRTGRGITGTTVQM